MRIYMPLLALMSLTLPSNLMAQTDVDNLHYTGEVFMMITDFCPRATQRAYGQSVSSYQYRELAKYLAAPFNSGGTKSLMNLPDTRGRRMMNAGQLTGGANYRFGREGGSYGRTVGRAMPPHSHETDPHVHGFEQHDHDAVLATSTDIVSAPNPGGNSFGAFPGGSNAYAAGAPNTDYMNADNIFMFHKPEYNVTGSSFDTHEFGDNAQVHIAPPYAVVSFCITSNGKVPAKPD